MWFWFLLGLIELALEFMLCWLPMLIAGAFWLMGVHAFVQLLILYW